MPPPGQRGEAWLREALDLAPHGFAMLSRIGQPARIEISFANRAWHQLASGIQNAAITRLLDAAAELGAGSSSTAAPGMDVAQHPLIEQRADGRAIELSLARFGDSILATAQDVTDRVLADRELRTSEERYRTLIDSLDAVISIDDRERGVVWVSPQGRTILGYEPAQLAERGFWRSIVVAEDRQRAAAVWDNDEDLDLYDLEYRVRRADGATIWLHERMKAVRSADGRVARWYGVASDVTTLMSLQAERVESARLEMMGMFAGGVAHDFKNLLFGIGMFTDLARRAPVDDERNADLDEVAAIVERGKGLVALLLNFATDQEVKTVALDPAAAVHAVEPVLRQLAGGSVELCVSTAPEVGRVRAVKAHIERVLFNLVSNALQAMPDGGRLDIEVRPGDRDKCPPSDAGWIVLVVRDTGVGMDEETRARAFDPFFTTRERTVGTGLGLPTVHRIVSSLGGTIDVQSEPGVGTTFTVLLPRIARQSRRPRRARSPRAGRAVRPDRLQTIRATSP